MGVFVSIALVSRETIHLLITRGSLAFRYKG